MSKEMSVNEAIKEVVSVFRDQASLYGDEVEEGKGSDLHNIITLLKRGEAMEKMWGKNIEEATYNSKEGEIIHPTRILLDLESLEQKYLKEAKQAETK